MKPLTFISFLFLFLGLSIVTTLPSCSNSDSDKNNSSSSRTAPDSIAGKRAILEYDFFIIDLIDTSNAVVIKAPPEEEYNELTYQYQRNGSNNAQCTITGKYRDIYTGDSGNMTIKVNARFKSPDSAIISHSFYLNGKLENSESNLQCEFYNLNP